MLKTAATFTASALSVAAARSALKTAHAVAVDVGADIRDTELLKSRFIETRLLALKINVRKCALRLFLAHVGLSIAKKSGTIATVRTKALVYGAAAGSAISIGR